MEAKKHGIARYVSIHITLFLVMLLVLFIVTIHIVYNWGSDDMVHYFMSLKAEQISRNMENGQLIPSPSILNGLEEQQVIVFNRWSEMPVAYQDYFQADSHQHEELLVHKQDGKVIYLMPYLPHHSDDFFYISHTYNEADDEYVMGVSIADLAIFIIIFSVLVAYGLIVRLVWAFIKPVQTLAEWSQSLLDHPKQEKQSIESPSQQPSDSIPKLGFYELDKVAEQFNQTIQALRYQNEKEKQFLRALSHELRTPLAISKASLELIEKTINDIPEKLSVKLNKIQRANESMESTSQSLLWLWSDNIAQFTPQTISIQGLVTDIIENNHYLIDKKNITVDKQFNADTIKADPQLIAMILRNVIRNAFQYSTTGTIQIQVDSNSLLISNPTEETHFKHAKSSQHTNDYGFGVGLYLVQTICRQLNWKFEIKHLKGQFIVQIKMKTA